MKKLKNGAKGILRMGLEVVRIYTSKRISRSAAEFSYFLILSIFPLLICVTAMLGSLNLTEEILMEYVSNLLPANIAQTIAEYLTYVGENFSHGMLFTGIVVMATSSSGAIRSIMNIMTDIQGESRYKGIPGMVFSFAFSIVFLFVFYFSGVIIVTGGWFINRVQEIFGIKLLFDAWMWFRFVLLFLILVAVIYVLYRLTAPREDPKRPRIFGAAMASATLVGFSIIFSTFIGLSSKYPVVYGSLASLIILMVWAYTCGTILIMGNVVNIVKNETKNAQF